MISVKKIIILNVCISCLIIIKQNHADNNDVAPSSFVELSHVAQLLNVKKRNGYFLHIQLCSDRQYLWYNNQNFMNSYSVGGWTHPSQLWSNTYANGILFSFDSSSTHSSTCAHALKTLPGSTSCTNRPGGRSLTRRFSAQKRRCCCLPLYRFVKSLIYP